MEKQKKYNEALAKSRAERNEQFKKLFEDTKIFAKRLDNYINESAANFGAYLNRMTDSLMGKLPKIDPAFAVLNNPFFPVATSLKSSSLPTHVKMKSAPSAASAGVLAILPLYSVIHFSALAVVLLKTVTLCPAFDI